MTDSELTHPTTPMPPEEPSPKAHLKGQDLIAYEASLAPNSPGVYRMLGDRGEVLYVGKAKSLKKRIVQYAQGRGHSNRILRMISLTVEMVLVGTRTEGEALLLEARLIKSLKPRYNILLRDDKSFAEILVRKDHEAPQITKHRGAHGLKGSYFGPFANGFAVNSTLDTLQRAFLLRTCTDAVYAGRSRPCMLHQIKRCSAPCTGEISLDSYQELVDEAEKFLKGQNRALIEELSSRMAKASDALEFEKAALLRDRVRALSQVSMSASIGLDAEQADVFALHMEGGQACVFAQFFRAGQNWGDRAYFPRIDDDSTPAEVLDAFLGQFYQDKPVPRLILLSHDLNEAELMSEALSLKAGYRVTLKRPQRGDKNEVLSRALDNARSSLGRKMADHSAQSVLLQGVAEVFDLSSPPLRIEIYDNSHLSGTHAVGGMVVAGPEGFMRGQYRKFTIRDLDQVAGDDYAMMREVFRRRFLRLIKGRDDPKIDKGFGRPDLILVDGGLGQLEAVLSVLAELELSDLVVVGVAKGPDRDAGLERFFMKDRAPFMLEKKSPVLYYLQRLRDEAHRYAIGANRQKREKSLTKNPLDEIGGIGAKRKRLLLQSFGSARGVGEATVAELMKIDGIHHALAQKIHDYFH